MDERIQKYEEKMKKTLASLESELVTIRAGRANPHILDKLAVDYYGAPTPLQQVANITVPEARMIQIQPWESSLIKGIEKAILLAKAVDGIYDSDPKTNPNAVKYDEISIEEVVAKKLAAMDLTASIMCMEQKMPMLVFALDEKDSIINAVHGKFVGTKVTV